MIYNSYCLAIFTIHDMQDLILCFSALPKSSLKHLNELQFFLKRIDVHIYMTFMQNIQNRFVAKPRKRGDVKFPPARHREMATFFFRINHKLCIATFLRGESKCLWDVKEQNSISKNSTFMGRNRINSESLKDGISLPLRIGQFFLA